MYARCAIRTGKSTAARCTRAVGTSPTVLPAEPCDALATIRANFTLPAGGAVATSSA